MVNGQKVFLSGPNLAWQTYGYDFGNGWYDTNGGALETLLQSVTDNGGNTVSKLLERIYHWRSPNEV